MAMMYVFDTSMGEGIDFIQPFLGDLNKTLIWMFVGTCLLPSIFSRIKLIMLLKI